MKGENKMDAKLPIDSSMELIFDKLEKFLKTETVVGEPIQIGDITLIPIISVSFGCGGGSGQGKDSKGSDGVGGGIGIGAKVSPDAILVIKNGEATILPIKQKHNIEKLINMVPELVKKFDINKVRNCCSNENSEEGSEE